MLLEGNVDEEQVRRIAQLKKAYEAGILDEDTYRKTLAAIGGETSYTATADQGGVVAQGGSMAVGSGGIGVGGDVGGPIVMGNVYVGIRLTTRERRCAFTAKCL